MATPWFCFEADKEFDWDEETHEYIYGLDEPTILVREHTHTDGTKCRLLGTTL